MSSSINKTRRRGILIVDMLRKQVPNQHFVQGVRYVRAGAIVVVSFCHCVILAAIAIGIDAAVGSKPTPARAHLQIQFVIDAQSIWIERWQMSVFCVVRFRFYYVGWMTVNTLCVYSKFLMKRVVEQLTLFLFLLRDKLRVRSLEPGLLGPFLFRRVVGLLVCSRNILGGRLLTLYMCLC